MGILRPFLSIPVFACILLLCNHAECQVANRLNGLTPQKWITVKHSLSPERVLQYDGQTFTADFEDIYAKIWIPLVVANKLKVAAGASYRTEQIETDFSSSELSKVNHWNLRSAGIDVRMAAQLSSQNSLIGGITLSQSATIQSLPLRSSPLNFSVSAVFMQRKSASKEIGFGLLHSNNMNFPLFPILVWNETFNKKNGIEISLPYKLAWRYNLSPRNIFHVKAEGTSRNYFLDQPSTHQCRRVDVDLGVAYTLLINKWIGFEFFGGLRKNISNELPSDITLKTGSGFAMSTELFVIPAFGSSKLKK